MQLLPRVATSAEVPDLLTLFCGASDEMKLEKSVCSQDERERLQTWFEQKCVASSLWTVDGRNSLVVLERNLFNVIEEVRYVVVSERHRRKGVAELEEMRQPPSKSAVR
jgi:hypothetical protein